MRVPEVNPSKYSDIREGIREIARQLREISTQLGDLDDESQQLGGRRKSLKEKLDQIERDALQEIALSATPGKVGKLARGAKKRFQYSNNGAIMAMQALGTLVKYRTIESEITALNQELRNLTSRASKLRNRQGEFTKMLARKLAQGKY